LPTIIYTCWAVAIAYDLKIAVIFTIYFSHMLMMSGTLRNQPVMSLRTGTQIAFAVEPIIDPRSLKILGWWCQVPNNKEQLVLLAEDVRERMPSGLAVNDEDALSAAADLVRHREMLDIKFQLVHKPVKNKRQKLGKVEDFTYDESMFIQKLYVPSGLRKVFSADDVLMIDRNQIIEVTDSYILVDDGETKDSVKAAVPASAAASG
jgi:hypothetical protein